MFRWLMVLDMFGQVLLQRANLIWENSSTYEYSLGFVYDLNQFDLYFEH